MITYDARNRQYDIDDSKEIARGGEGKIIKVDKKTVAKIYLSGITPITEQKFKDLSEIKKLEFIIPSVLLYDKKGNVIGYLMSSVDSDYFPLYSAYNNNFVQRKGLDQNWKKDIAKILIECVEYIHSKNIVIGDLSGFNVLVKNNDEVRFIDVDSYQTPSEKHNGRMLLDIRDHLYGGLASKESDYFSLAVIIFNLFTTVHPFKGTHRVYKGLEDREIRKIPVFDNDPDLIIPKCYSPIVDKNLQDQFNRIFKLGDRFLLSLNPAIVIPKFIYNKKVSTHTDSLKITEMYTGIDIKYVKCSNTRCCVIEKDKLTVFETEFNQNFRVLYTLNISVDDVIPTDDKIFLLKDGQLYLIQKDSSLMLMNDINIKDILYFRQYENLYVIVTEDMMYVFKLDTVTGNHIKYQTIKVYGHGFKNYQGLVQSISGVSVIRYNSKGVLNTLKFPFPIKDIYQNGSIGMAQYLENDDIKHCVFNIEGLKVNVSGTNYDRIKQIGNSQGQYIVIPEDGALSFIRENDFYPMARYESDLIDDSTQVFVTKTGIIAINQNKIHLINRK